ncbi:MAG: EAL domain-containing protein [Deltaproteobacteria bacterium]|nr:EAL domain-containing protein [Deltaproteobacteria bacterium]
MPASEDSGQARPRVLIAADPTTIEGARRILGERFLVMGAASREQMVELLDEHGDTAVLLAAQRLDSARGSDLMSQAQRIRPRTRRILLMKEHEMSIVIEAVNDGRIAHVLQLPLEEEHNDLVGALAEDFQRSRREKDALAQLQSDSRELGKREHELKRQLDETRQNLRSANGELAQLTRELEVLSFRDPLTGLYNHRAFQERLREELARATRYEQPLSLVFCDVDNFGEINSRLGYQIGDETLRKLATSVFSSTARVANRKSDVSARFSGELFAAALPETSKDGARVKAERMRELVAAMPDIDGIKMSASIGLASYPEDADSADSLIKAARSALRSAKNAGKNTVVAFGEQRSAEMLDDDDEPGTNPPIGKPLLGSGPPRFPSYHQRMAEIVAALERNRAVASLYVDLSHLRKIEQEYGLTRHASFFAKAGTILHELQGTHLRRDDLICRTEVDDAYVCILSPARHKGSGSSIDLSAIARRVESVLDQSLGAELAELGSERPRLTVGYSRVLNNPLMRAERLIARLIDEARKSAAMLRERTIYRDKVLLQELILNRHLRAVYQPIVHLESGETFGFESLTRGPTDTRLEMPTELFSIADEVDLTFELDRACFRGALRAAVGLEPIHRLFVNILPLSFYDASFIEDEVSRLVEEADLTPANLVFEITERLAIENFSAFRRALARYTAMGFGVAIDDVGTRHSNLETVMALRPHFIKISDILTRGVATSTVKREMLRSLGRIAEAIDAVIVAEGIENADDLAVLCDLGVRYGQGYFLARPGPAFPVVPGAVKDTVKALARGGLAIPEPEEEMDDDGDFREPGKPSSGVHRAVVDRIQSVPGHEAAKSMLERLERLREQDEANSPQDWALGTLPPTPVLDNDEYEGPDTGMHRMSGQFLEWTPIKEEDLGREASESGSSLLASLRRRDPSTSDPESGPDDGSS